MNNNVIHSAVGRRGLHAHVVDEVGRRIVSGAIAQGSVLDLSSLEAEFDVSHTAMREAIKVLTAKQLVDARPKLGTYVLPRLYWNLLDADVMDWRGQDLRLQEELAEVRDLLEPAAAALAAKRASAEDMHRMTGALDVMDTELIKADTVGDSGWQDVTDADVEFHAAVAAATGNELFEHVQRLLVPAIRARDLVTLPSHHARDFVDDHRAVADAIASGDVVAARGAMTSLLARSTEDFHAGRSHREATSGVSDSVPAEASPLSK